jgi:NhaP-type Na+/H+ and K+/H+ antiporter
MTKPSLFAVSICPESSYCGIRLANIQLPRGCAVLGILRERQVILLEESTVIHCGDWILAIALHPMMQPELNAVLSKTHSVYYSLNDCSLEDHALQNAILLADLKSNQQKLEIYP